MFSVWFPGSYARHCQCDYTEQRPVMSDESSAVLGMLARKWSLGMWSQRAPSTPREAGSREQAQEKPSEHQQKHFKASML